MTFDPVRMDPEKEPGTSGADVSGFVVPSTRTGERMSAALFTPQGGGPRPTVLLLHGYPGDENNYDLAHVFQRAGFTTVVFHYRGTWGSEGKFSLCHVLEDVTDMIDFIEAHTGGESYRFDAGRLLLAGHSMGGFAALETAARDPRPVGVAAMAAFDFSLAAKLPKLREAVRGEFSDCLPIRRIGLDELMAEIDRHAAEWSFPALAQGLSGKPVCLIAGTRDRISAPKSHFFPLLEALKRGGVPVVSSLLEDGHCLSASRIALADTLIRWASGLPGLSGQTNARVSSRSGIATR